MNAITLLFGQTKESIHGNADQSSAAQSKTAHQHGGKLTARTLIGKPVEDRTGDTIATVNDLLLDPQSGRVMFVVLASGGFAGMGVKLRAIPPNALSRATAKRGILALDIGPNHWKKAPLMNKEQLAGLENGAAARAIYAFYHQPWLDSTNRSVPAQSVDPVFHLKPASELIGESVINRRAGEVGRVADLAVDLNNSAPAQAVITPTGQGNPFNVPVNQLGSDASGNNLLLNDDNHRSHSSAQDAKAGKIAACAPETFSIVQPVHGTGFVDSRLQFKPQPLTSLCKR